MIRSAIFKDRGIIEGLKSLSLPVLKPHTQHTFIPQGGQYVLQLLDEFGLSVTLLTVVMLESIAVTWFYGVRRFQDDINSMLGFYPGIYWVVCWTAICPSALLVSYIKD